MKRDLDFALGAESELTSSLDGGSSHAPTLVEADSTDCLDENFGTKRFRGTKVNGFIVYTRMRKSRSRNYVELLDDSALDKAGIRTDLDRDNPELRNVHDDNHKVINVHADNHKVKIIADDVSKVENVKLEDSPVFKSVNEEFQPVENVLREIPVAERGIDGEERICDFVSPAKGNNLKKKALKWLKQSSLKLNNEPVEVLVTQSESFESNDMSHIKVEAIAEGSALSSPKKNLELKMSKKIVLNKKPMTVTELFETGLLDGISVIYMGGIKVGLNTIMLIIYLVI